MRAHRAVGVRESTLETVLDFRISLGLKRAAAGRSFGVDAQGN
jgi:hypothetical protein